MKLLVLAPLPERAAATRFRVLQYFPALRRAGITPELRPFFDDVGFELLYRAGAIPDKVSATLRAVLGRLRDVVASARCDGVLIQREAALFGPPLIEWALTSIVRVPVIFDFDDAVWVPYASPTYGALASQLLKAPSKAYYTVRRAARVFAGNDHLRSWALAQNADVELFPTIVDAESFHPAPTENEVPVLGWIGTHSTAPYLQALAPVLQQLARERRFVLRVVGGHVTMPGVDVEEREWTLEREVADFQGLDVGLYPLPVDEWALGKSAFKAIEYMACGVPVVASPVGFTQAVVRDGETGFLARDEAAWLVALRRLLDDHALRRRLGARGRADVLEKWCLDVYAPRFVAAVTSVLQRS